MILASVGLVFAQSELPDGRFALALFCNPTCSDEVIQNLDDALVSVKARSGFPQRASKSGRIMGIAGTEFGIPDADFVAEYGVSVDRVEELAKSEQVILAWFAAPRDQARDVFRLAHKAFGDAAVASGGWVEDLDTQKIYGAAAWNELDPGAKLADWYVIDGDLVDPADPDGDLRLVTRGLRRFGLPDLVVDGVSPDAAGDVSFVLAAVAEALSTRSDLPDTLEVADDTVNGNATFTELGARDTDPLPPLYEVNFDGEITLPVMPGTELEEPPVVPPGAPVAVVSATIMPPSPAPAPAPPPVEPAPAPAAPQTLEQAQRAALARLDTDVRSAFSAGLNGGAVAVNVPFSTSSGAMEYLWIELRGWEGDIMTGVVANEPRAVAGMRKGDVVQVRQSQVFDYVWKKADGSREGNTTAAFLRN